MPRAEFGVPPVMDGAAMLAQVKRSSAWRKTPVVMMSSIPEATVAERCHGYALFLRKPFNVFQAIDVVGNLT